MSQARALAALTDEWQTTSEIADAIPKWERQDRIVHIRAVHRDLDRLAKSGQAEKSMTPPGRPGQRKAMWRLKA